MKDWKKQCAAVIPCYNEAGKIGAVVGNVRRYLDVVIVVDDGSSDATAAEAAAAGAVVTRHPANRGKGCALRSGWDQARQAGFEWALALDGDGQHDANDILQFLHCAEVTSAHLIIGNRMDDARKMPRMRRWANTTMSRWLSRLTNTKLPDSQCGFRLVHLPTVTRLAPASRRFVIESETLVAFLLAGEQVEFVSVRVIYGPGKSRICPLRDTFRWLRWWAAQLRATPS